MTAKKRLFTGLQPSGRLHIGNYFGSLKPLLDIYTDYDGFLMVADYHALTTIRNPEALRQNIVDIVKDYLALGIDTDKVVLFKQSDVPQHAELAWIFQTLVTVPFLMRAHAYKDKVAKGIEPNAGLFSYPMLMASDILLYDGEVVPVGEDQRQHIEYAREAAMKFNNAFGETFTPPQEHIMKGVGVVPGTDGNKMSKSYNNTIPLFASREEIEKAVMSIVTDSNGDRPENVYAIHTLFRDESELEDIYNDNRGKYGELKKILIEDIDAFIKPLREKRASITDDEVKDVLAKGAKKAQDIANKKMEDIHNKIGVMI